VYRKRLSGLALDEINLSPVLLKKIQTRLIELQFLSGNADAVFGANTRAAIRNYQASIDHVQSDFLSVEERSMLLDPPALQAQALEPKQAAASEAISPPEEAPISQQPDSPSLQSTDNRPFRQDATEHAIEQTPQLKVADAGRPPDNVEIATPVDRGSRLKTRYLIEGGTIAGVILVLAVDCIFVTLRRRIKLRRQNAADHDLSGVSLKKDMARTKPSMQGTGGNLDNAGHTTSAAA
jgi:hypothetical protein